MTVKELIEFLQTQPQEIQVAYDMYSERSLLKKGEIQIVQGCAPRPDGWVQNARPDMPQQDYLLFPGN